MYTLAKYTYNHLEFTTHDTTSVDIACIGLEAFIVTQNLTGTGSRHRCYQQGIADTMLSNTLSQCVPVPAIRRLDSPHVRLQDTLADGRAFISLIWSIYRSNFAGRFQSSVINCFENILVQLLSFW